MRGEGSFPTRFRCARARIAGLCTVARLREMKRGRYVLAQSFLSVEVDKSSIRFPAERFSIPSLGLYDEEVDPLRFVGAVIFLFAVPSFPRSGRAAVGVDLLPIPIKNFDFEISDGANAGFRIFQAKNIINEIAIWGEYVGYFTGVNE